MTDISEQLDLPGQILDKVAGLLDKVGIELPALVSRLFLLALVTIVLWFALRKIWGKKWRRAKLPQTITAGALALVWLGIVYGVVWQLLAPDRLGGRVAGPALTEARVELLDFQGWSVSSGGSVDTQTGEFVAYYSPGLYGRARKLRISSPSCKAVVAPIPPGRLGRGAENTWSFPCERP